MIRLVGLALAGLLALVQPLNAAGTVPGFSLTPQFDTNGKVMPGCKLYVIQAGTTQTPQNSYQDSALTILQPNPLVCDATGRLPQWFVADGQIKVRLTNAAGSQQFIGDNLLVIGASTGGGGGGTVDPTTVLSTGDVKYRYGDGVLTGFVRMNGRTIGSATSGATERANADCQALFEYLWNTDTLYGRLTVSGGRGASANADWVANKTITTPDARGRVMASPDGMGNSSAGRLAFNLAALNDTLGASGGSDNHTMTLAELVAHSHANTLNDPGHTHTGVISSGLVAFQGGTGAVGFGAGTFNPVTINGQGVGVNASASNITINNASAGSTAASSILQPTILVTTYVKL